jgi:hypothetical protein
MWRQYQPSPSQSLMASASPSAGETAGHFRQRNGRFRLVLSCRRRHTWDDPTNATVLPGYF